MFVEIDPATLIASGAIVVFLTQQAKRWVPTDFLPLVALLLGIAIQVTNDVALATEAVNTASVWLSIVTGAGVGMAAAGAYDLATAGTAQAPRGRHAAGAPTTQPAAPEAAATTDDQPVG